MRHVFCLPKIGNLGDPQCFCGQLRQMLHFLAKMYNKGTPKPKPLSSRASLLPQSLDTLQLLK